MAECEEFIANLVQLLRVKAEADWGQRDREREEAGLGMLHQGRAEAFEEVLGEIRRTRFWPGD
jgi:hypothetical protein